MNLVQGNPLDILQSVSKSTSYWNYRIHITYSGCVQYTAKKKNWFVRRILILRETL